MLQIQGTSNYSVMKSKKTPTNWRKKNYESQTRWPTLTLLWPVLPPCHRMKVLASAVFCLFLSLVWWTKPKLAWYHNCLTKILIITKKPVLLYKNTQNFWWYPTHVDIIVCFFKISLYICLQINSTCYSLKRCPQFL